LRRSSSSWSITPEHSQHTTRRAIQCSDRHMHIRSSRGLVHVCESQPQTCGDDLLTVKATTCNTLPARTVRRENGKCGRVTHVLQRSSSSWPTTPAAPACETKERSAVAVGGLGLVGWGSGIGTVGWGVGGLGGVKLGWP
jgi:hypothetical protein